jgi:putative aldouronate transport system substrate-binding protein
MRMSKEKTLALLGLALVLAFGASVLPLSASGAKGPIELSMAYITWNGVPSDLAAVEKQINDTILVPKLNIKVKLTPINAGSWTDQTNLMLASGDPPVDLMQMFGRNLLTTVGSGQLIAMDDYLKTKGPDIMNKVDPTLWPGCVVNGKTYCVPLLSRTYGVDYAVSMRTDLMKKYGIKVDRFDSSADLEKVLKIVKEKDPSIIPLICDGSLAWRMPSEKGDRVFSNLSYFTCGVVPEDSKDLTVENYYSSPEYKLKIQTLRRWYKLGYLDPNNAVTSSEDNRARWNAGKVFARFDFYTPGWVYGDNFTMVRFGTQGEPRVGTGEISIFGWTIPHSSKHPAEAMALLNEIYSNQDLVNLLSWGIEGKHYRKTCTAAREITYPDGVTSKTVGYFNDQNYAFGDFFGAYYLDSSDKSIVANVLKFNKEKKKSRYLGFAIDVAPIKTEMAAVDSVIARYSMPLECGVVDPDDQLPKFLAALQSAGIDKTMAEFQKQLRAWAKATNLK